MALPAITFRLANVVVSNFQQMVDNVNQAAATLATGWTVGKIATVNNSPMDVGVEQATGTFVTVAGTPLPGTSLVTGATAAAFRSDYPLNGQFANANWVISVVFRSVTIAYTGTIRARVRIFRSVNADGSAATELTGAVQTGTTAPAGSTSADTTSTVTWAPGGIVTLNNEYLFIAVALEIVTASGSNTADALLRTGSAAATGSVATTPSFTEFEPNQATGAQSMGTDATVDPSEQTQAIAVIADDEFIREGQTGTGTGSQGTGDADAHALQVTATGAQDGTVTRDADTGASSATSDQVIDEIISNPNIIDDLTVQCTATQAIVLEATADADSHQGSGSQSFSTEFTSESDVSESAGTESLFVDATSETQGSAQVVSAALAALDAESTSNQSSGTGTTSAETTAESDVSVAIAGDAVTTLDTDAVATVGTGSYDTVSAESQAISSSGDSSQTISEDEIGIVIDVLVSQATTSISLVSTEVGSEGGSATGTPSSGEAISDAETTQADASQQTPEYTYEAVVNTCTGSGSLTSLETDSVSQNSSVQFDCGEATADVSIVLMTKLDQIQEYALEGFGTDALSTNTLDENFSIAPDDLAVRFVCTPRIVEAVAGTAIKEFIPDITATVRASTTNFLTYTVTDDPDTFTVEADTDNTLRVEVDGVVS